MRYDVERPFGAFEIRPSLKDSGAAFSIFNEATGRLRQIKNTASLALLAVLVLLRSVSRRKRCVVGQQTQRQSLARLATEEL